MKKWTIVLAVVAVIALAFGVFSFVQKGDVQKKLDEATGKVTELTSQIADLKTQAETAAADLTAKTTELDGVKAELEGVKAELETAKADLAAATAPVAEAVEETVENVTEAVEGAVEGATEAVADVAATVTETATEAVETVTETAEAAVEGATEAAADVAETVTETAESAVEAATGAVEGVVAAVAGDTAEPEKKAVKVGFIFLHDENSTYDLNFLNAAKEACEALGVEYMIKTNIDEGEACYQTAAELVDEGCNVVFADSFGHESFMIQAAKEFPEVQFCHATGVRAHTENLANYHNAFASIYEGRFLAGVAAGLKLNEMIESGKITAEQAKIGYVGAYPYAEVKSGYTSFFLGVRSVCPSVTMEVTFTNSWYDEALEKEGANQLMDNGCVLISQHADSMGAPTACETREVPNVSYNGSTVAACPKTFIVSSRINWVPYMKYMIECVQKGEAIDVDWTGTNETGSVELSDVNEQAAAVGTVEKLAEVKAGLLDGSVKVFNTAAFTKGGEAVTTYLADVDDMGDFVGETEVIVDGVFAESKFRSAPYFDIDIDGITILGSGN